MGNTRRVSPAEAKQLLDEGYTYVDVRTEEEFRACHPTGALNVPMALWSPVGPRPNGEFVDLIRRLFGEEGKIVLGCATGQRSLRAAEMLEAAGFRDVIDQRAGLDGVRNPFGRLEERGWAAAGLPVSSGIDEGSYDAVKLRPQGAWAARS